MKSLIPILAIIAFIGCSQNNQNVENERFPILRTYVGKEISIFIERNELIENSRFQSYVGKLEKISNDGLLITSTYLIDNNPELIREYEAWIPMTSIRRITTHNETLKLKEEIQAE